MTRRREANIPHREGEKHNTFSNISRLFYWSILHVTCFDFTEKDDFQWSQRKAFGDLERGERNPSV